MNNQLQHTQELFEKVSKVNLIEEEETCPLCENDDLVYAHLQDGDYKECMTCGWRDDLYLFAKQENICECGNPTMAVGYKFCKECI